ncbi:MAG: hypothetical protein OIF40_08940 [Mangrovicoccus sp.]|nr:hypothetical protein [Mangrovicoccus sp.]
MIALGILSLLFVLSHPNRDGEPLRFVEDEAAAASREEHLAHPDYRSITETGGALRLKAQDLRPVPETEGEYTGTKLEGWIDGRNGRAYALSGATGALNEAQGLAWLRGDVRLIQSDGHVATSQELEIHTDLTRLVSPGPVHAFGPTGTLDADSMEMLGQPDLSSGTVTIFRGNVRLLYDPQDPEPEQK